MATKIYVGINDVAREVTNIYIGVNGVARKVSDGYLGINGIAERTYRGVIPVAPPSVSVGSYTYSGSAQGPTITDSADVSMYTKTNVTKTDAGTYTLTVSLNDKKAYVWSDTMTTDDKTYSYIIAKKTVAPPTVSNTSFTYSGSSYAPTVTHSSDSSWYTVTNTAQTNAGSYSVIAALKNGTSGNNVVWTDNTSANKSTAWSIAKKKVVPPTVSATSKTYSGGAQAPTVTNSSDSSWYTVTNTSQTNAGTYYVSVALKAGTSGANVIWNDTNTAANKSISWTIAKKRVLPPTISVGSYTYNGSAQGPSLTNSSDSGWYSVSNRTNTNAGSYTCTVSLNAGTGGSNVVWNDTGTAASKTYNYTIGKANRTLKLASVYGCSDAYNSGTYIWKSTTTGSLYVYNGSHLVCKSANTTARLVYTKSLSLFGIRFNDTIDSLTSSPVNNYAGTKVITGKTIGDSSTYEISGATTNTGDGGTPFVITATKNGDNNYNAATCTINLYTIYA